MIITLTREEIYCNLNDFYKNVGLHIKDDIMGYMFDCRHIDVSNEIQDTFFEYYKTEWNLNDGDIAMGLAIGGPKVNKNLTGYEIEVDDRFMTVGTYEDLNVSDKVIDNVKHYIQDNLPEYNTYMTEVYHKSNHDADNYLYMVLAKKNTLADNDYAVWTCWNESTQSLNHGHYNITREQADAILKENFFDCTGELEKTEE